MISLTCYKIILETLDWQKLNWLDAYVNEKTDYYTEVKEWLNVGESMATKLEVKYFKSEEVAREFLRVVFAYYGKSLDNIKITYSEVKDND